MNDITGSISGKAGAEAVGLLRRPRFAASWTAGILALWLAATAVLYFRMNGTVTAGWGQGFPSQSPDHVVYGTLMAIAVSGMVALLMAAIGVVMWRLSLQRKWQDKEGQWVQQIQALEQRVAQDQEARRVRLETELEREQQMAALRKDNAALQDALDNLRRSERDYSRERQFLESSKTVLELHVQERTQAVQELKHRYEMILDSAGDGICGLDLNGKAAFANPAAARLTGWAREDLLGKTEQEIFYNGKPVPPESQASHCGALIFRRRDGTPFPAELVRTPIQDGDRKTGEVLIFKDITERKRAEEVLSQKAAELARSNAELEQFAFVASHDLQEPLRKIQAFGDRLKTKCNGSLPPDALDYLERMQGASARMRTLIDDLLAFSRVIRKSEPFELVDLGQVTREVLGDLEVRIERSGGRVEVGELPQVEADPTQMRQLLLNLIGNALKFQPPGGKPEVKVTARTFASISGERYCELSVQDNGIGFEEQHAEKIFAVFQRLHGRGEYEGTGVGLAVCRRIADRHQGSIVARSQLGKGATFIVTLPICQKSLKASA